MLRWTKFMLVALLIAACTTGTPTDERATPVDAQQILELAVNNLRALDTFRLDLFQGGVPYLFEFQLGAGETPFVTALTQAEAAFIAPDVLWASSQITFRSLPLNVGLLATSKGQWLQPLAGVWLSYAYAPGFDPGTIMLEGRGFARAMTQLENLVYEGQQSLNGSSVHHMRGTATGDVVNDILFGLLTILQETVMVDVYVNTDSEQVNTLVLTLPDTATETEEDTYWSIEIYDYNAEIELDIPDEAR